MKTFIKTIALCGMLIAPTINGAAHDYLFIGKSKPKATLCGVALGALSLTAASAACMLFDNDICKLIAGTAAMAGVNLIFIIAYKKIKEQHEKATTTSKADSPV